MDMLKVIWEIRQIECTVTMGWETDNCESWKFFQKQYLLAAVLENLKW